MKQHSRIGIMRGCTMGGGDGDEKLARKQSHQEYQDFGSLNFNKRWKIKKTVYIYSACYQQRLGGIHDNLQKEEKGGAFTDRFVDNSSGRERHFMVSERKKQSTEVGMRGYQPRSGKIKGK